MHLDEAWIARTVLAAAPQLEAGCGNVNHRADGDADADRTARTGRPAAARGCPSCGVPAARCRVHPRARRRVGSSRYPGTGTVQRGGPARWVWNLSAGYPPSISEPVAQRGLAVQLVQPDQLERACPAKNSHLKAEGRRFDPGHQEYQQFTGVFEPWHARSIRHNPHI